MHKCYFGSTEVNFLGRTGTPEGVKPQKESITNFLEKKNGILEIQKGLTTIPWTPQLLQKLHTETVRITGSFFSTT